MESSLVWEAPGEPSLPSSLWLVRIPDISRVLGRVLRYGMVGPQSALEHRRFLVGSALEGRLALNTQPLVLTEPSFVIVASHDVRASEEDQPSLSSTP